MLDVILKGAINVLTPINISRKEHPDSHRGVCYFTMPTSGGKVKMPHVPGETFKGLLRSCAADVASRAAGGDPYPLEEYYLLYKGGIKQSGSESVADIVRAHTFRRANPVLGLFGAAAPGWLPGAIAVGPSVPGSVEDFEIYESDGARRDEIRLDPEMITRFSQADVEKYVEYREGVQERGNGKKRVAEINKELRLLKDKGDTESKSLKLALETERASIQSEEKDSRKNTGEGGVGNTVGRPLPLKFGIAPGSTLESRLDVIRGTEEEVGLFFTALKELSNRCRIGGMTGIGYGLFKAEWTILIRSDPGEDFVEAGTVAIAPESYQLKSNSPLIADAIEAWKARAAKPESLSLKDYV